MDKLITTNNGGIPYVNDDFRWSDESIRDYINSQLNDISASGLGTNGNFVISGVEITDTGTEYIITDGYMWIDGEVLKVDAGTYAYPAQEYRFEAVETFDPTGEKVTRSGATIDTYRKRRAVPINRNIASPVTDGQLRLALLIGSRESRLNIAIPIHLNDITQTIVNGNLTTTLYRIGNLVHGKVVASAATDIGGVTIATGVSELFLPSVDCTTHSISLFEDESTTVFPLVIAPFRITPAGNIVHFSAATAWIRTAYTITFSYTI